ncbi:hypothetical protein [Microbispora sp. NPDC049633]|uniref:hypothetical protein n=1 Tax=Microbispora sp. NPDC049633 TaxID=3154355 RepID=UPI003441C674
MAADNPSELNPADDAEIHIVGGRQPAPFAMVPLWVMFSTTPQAQALYGILAAHVNPDRDDRNVWPSRATLAEMLGFNRPASVDRYLSELQEIGAVDVIVRRRTNGSQMANAYVVHHQPPDGYTGIRSMRDYYARRKDNAAGQSTPGEETAGQDRVRQSVPPLSAVADTPRTPQRTRSRTREVEQEEDLHSAPKALSRRARKKKTPPAEEIQAPGEFLFGDEEIPGLAERARRSSRSPGSDTGMGLADHFARRMVELGELQGLDVSNRAALAATFNRWKKAGATPDQIRHMIEAYASNSKLRSPGAVPWMDFLGKRARLLAEAQRRIDLERSRPENFRPEDWEAPADTPHPFATPDGEFDAEAWMRSFE